MNMQAEIQAAAKRLEDLINNYPTQVDVSIDKIDMQMLYQVYPRKIFSIRIVSIQPVQIYPPTGS